MAADDPLWQRRMGATEMRKEEDSYWVSPTSSSTLPAKVNSAPSYFNLLKLHLFHISQSIDTTGFSEKTHKVCRLCNWQSSLTPLSFNSKLKSQSTPNQHMQLKVEKAMIHPANSVQHNSALSNVLLQLSNVWPFVFFCHR